MNNYDLEEQFQVNQNCLDTLNQAIGNNSTPLDTLLVKAIEGLTAAQEELYVAAEELYQQNEELIATRQALEEERQRYQELFEFAPDAYLVTNTSGIIQEANCAAEAIFNLQAHYLQGKPLVLFVSKEDKTNFYSQLQLGS